MSLALTPEMLAAAYEFLRCSAPFKDLPHADEVEFHVTRHRDREADMNKYKSLDEYIVRVSSYYVKTTAHLLEAMAHEMAHMVQRKRGPFPKGDPHDKVFMSLARRVCKTHGFPDLKSFVGI